MNNLSSNSAAANPPGPDEDTGSVTHIRGSTVSVFRSMLVEERGPEGWLAVLASIPAPLRVHLDQEIGAYAWIPAAPVLALEAVLPQDSKAADAWLRGSTAAEQHLKVAHRWLLSLISVETILRQASLLFRFYYKGGRAWLESMEKGEARVAFKAEGIYAAWYTATLPAYLKRILELGGAAEVVVHHLPPSSEGAKVHLYDIRWQD